MRRVLLPPAILWIALASSSCADGSGNGDRASAGSRTERVRSGDTTIIRTLGANSPSAELALVQEVVVGKREGAPEEMFQEIEHVTPMPDGGMLLFDYGAYMVRRYDSTGKYLNSIGRSGKGPGEYQSVTRVGLIPDGKVLVTGAGKFSLFEATGALIRGWSMNFTDPTSAGTLRAITADGQLHVSRRAHDPRYPDSLTVYGERLSTNAVYRMSLDGAMLDTVLEPRARTQPPRFEYKDRLNETVGRAEVPLAPVFRTAYSNFGYWVSGGDGNSYAIMLERREGGPLRIESDLPPVAAIDEEREALLYSMTYNLRRQDPDATPRIDIIPKLKPPFRGITTDSEGRIWVLLSRSASPEEIDTMPKAGVLQMSAVVVAKGGTIREVPVSEPKLRKPTERWVEPPVYDVFAPTGEFLGRVKLPPRATFGNSANDKIWLIVKDELDVPVVVRYRVTQSNSELPAAGWR